MKKKEENVYKEMTDREMQHIQGSGNMDETNISEHNFSAIVLGKGAGHSEKKG
ncbi:hypothetical protein C823_006717 [Eubacterium plexicaudatum ASF492]|uniref:Bacteriocin-type signal sequence n=1 Tax=Eubacterium plexicaudatum ASF492 TaxID=1235802 RepID=N2AIB3_9FIRM|nr:hypothetical protein C823_006717 [Eubacterium plexicaudatum ASF492]